MRTRFDKLGRPALCLFAALAFSSWAASGCASGSSAATLFGGSLFTSYTGTTPPPTGGATGGESGFFTGGSRVNVDPCSESNARKFVRVSMRNQSPDDFIHYFFVAIAYVNGEQFPNGAVCPDDVDLYTSFGYSEVPEGVSQPFGNFCIDGPALLYFHEGGRFRSGGGVAGSRLASAIAPAQGTNATFDNFFGSGGVVVPVPNMIIFHNPGTGEGAFLKVSLNNTAPCADQVVVSGDPECQQDGFYYVDEDDRSTTGSVALGVGSGIRVPNEIQGSGCECSAFATFGGRTFQVAQVLAPSGTAASNARCNEFLRGGLIEYVFVREDTDPPFPQLVWRVTDQTGAEVHDFDPRAGIP